MPENFVSDDRRLKQVLINLISNALKFTSEGSIQVHSKFDTESKMLYFDVIDSGVGIKKADQVQLFKMFGKLQYTSKQNQQGIGLGLNVCKRIVNEYNGEMSVQSDIGKGSKFSFGFQVKEFTLKASQDGADIQELRQLNFNTNEKPPRA